MSSPRKYYEKKGIRPISTMQMYEGRRPENPMNDVIFMDKRGNVIHTENEKLLTYDHAEFRIYDNKNYKLDHYIPFMDGHFLFYVESL